MSSINGWSLSCDVALLCSAAGLWIGLCICRSSHAEYSSRVVWQRRMLASPLRLLGLALLNNHAPIAEKYPALSSPPVKAAWPCGRPSTSRPCCAHVGCTVELLGMTTKGDQILDRTLSKVGGKGLFVKELEVALEEGRAHIAVHSLKDVPMDTARGLWPGLRDGARRPARCLRLAPLRQPGRTAAGRGGGHLQPAPPGAAARPAPRPED